MLHVVNFLFRFIVIGVTSTIFLAKFFSKKVRSFVDACFSDIELKLRPSFVLLISFYLPQSPCPTLPQILRTFVGLCGVIN